ncbi:MAG: insulinase family protein [Parabacteroides sp.]|nr:insulinase family protein [Parabacteroides sp.]
MKRYIKICKLIILCFISFFIRLQAQEMQPMPIDPKVRYGKLDNGLTYYIRHNELPENRADFYIAQNVGSVLEEDNQAGLAHFLEHMAFNGTKNFPENGIDKYLQSVGMRMGENLNAYTSFDETVYTIINAPVDKPNVLDSCLLILHDWSNSLALTDSMIEKERGIIREEWRTRRDASQRLMEKQLQQMFPGNKYANRIPIGSIDVINNFKPEELRAYYKKWYRPDLQAIIVVGDVDVDTVEKTIKTMFSDIPAPVNPAKREYVSVADNDEPIVSIATDKEASSTIIYIYHKYDPMPAQLRSTAAGLITDYISAVCSQILNERLEALLHQANPPFVYAEAYDGDFMVARTKDAFTIAAIAKEGEIDSTMTTLVREMERARQFGFTVSEYERAKINILKQYESAFNERDKQKNSSYTKEYVNHFTEGGYIPGIETEYTLINQIAPNITVEQVNQYLSQVIGEKNIVLAISGPEKEGVVYPTESELLEMFNKARSQKVEPYKEEVNNDPLIPELPAPGKIVKEEHDGLFDATVLTLSNGVRVVLKPTEYKKDEIQMTATSPGGSFMVGIDDAKNMKVFNSVIGLGGLGNFSAIDLSKKLAGKKVSCSASLGVDNESLNGYASPDDVKTLFELIYLAMTSPRTDNDAYASFESRMKAQLENAKLDPSTALNDTISKVVYNNHPRAVSLEAEDFDKISYQRIHDIYKERYGDASDFTFTFVGNLNVDSIRPYIEQYIATLPANGRVDNPSPDALPKIAKGELENHFSREMQTPKSSVFQLYSGKSEYNLKNLLTASLLSQILDLVYTETIREAEGGSYGVYAGVSLSDFPKGQTTLQVFFDTDPEKWENMVRIVDEEIQRIATEGPKSEHLTKSRDNMLKRHNERLQENSYWLNVIDSYYFRGLDAYTNYKETLESITADDIKKFMSDFISQGNCVEVVMGPK